MRDIDFSPAKVEMLSSDMGKVVLERGQPAYAAVLQRSREVHRAPGDAYAYMGWTISRKFDKSEIERAGWFHLRFESVWLGDSRPERTVYDDSLACPFCGKGRAQLTPMILPSAMPKRNVIETAGRGVLLSAQSVRSLISVQAKGFDVCPSIVSGTQEAKDLIRRAKRGENLLSEYRIRIEDAENVGSTNYYQVLPRSRPLQFSDQQETGIEPGFEGVPCPESCPLGHSIGWALLGPLKVQSILDPDSDWHVMEKTTNSKGGLFMPQTHTVVSRKVWQAIDDGRRDRHEFDVVEVDEC